MSLLESERHYIGALFAEGQSPAQARDDLIQMGWHRKAAERAVGAFVASTPQAIAGPRPRIDHLPTELCIGGQTMQIQVRMHRPALVVVSNFLSIEECSAAIDESRPSLTRSKVIVGDGEVDEDGVQAYSRTSDEATFRPGTSELFDRLSERAAEFAQWPVTHIENPHVVRYNVGADFAPHHDYFCPTAHKSMIAREGQRVGSIIVYLNTPGTGGLTSFPEAELEIYPQRGNALFFSYPDATPDSQSLHSGVPLGSGEKWIATFFLRDRALDARLNP